MKHSKLLALLLTATMLAACTEPDGAPGRGITHGGALSKSDIGTAVGVIGGGVIGSTIGGGAGRTAAIIGGGLLGGFLGSEIGGSLDNADRAAYDRASQRAMESGKPRTWKNTGTGHRGKITPHKRYRNADGMVCREYTQTIYVDGKSEKGHGTACREQDGTWNLID